MKYPRSNRSYPTTAAFLAMMLLLLVSGRLAQLHAESSPAPPLKVAFVISNNANVIDMTGPWEVFQDTTTGEQSGFELFTVSESADAITMTGGLRVVPNYTFENTPHPDLVVIGAQEGTPHLSDWLRGRASDSRVVMSVCTGAFKLANAGLLDGKKATTHHEFWETFAKKFPKVDLQRGNRFVQSSDVIYTAGGLTSGIDLALHIVEKFYGREAADRTAAYMEHRRSSAKDEQPTGVRPTQRP
jgi:transcriptional regulator GlxA family with amidase domain